MATSSRRWVVSVLVQVVYPLQLVGADALVGALDSPRTRESGGCGRSWPAQDSGGTSIPVGSMATWPTQLRQAVYPDCCKMATARST